MSNAVAIKLLQSELDRRQNILSNEFLTKKKLEAEIEISEATIDSLEIIIEKLKKEEEK